MDKYFIDIPFKLKDQAKEHGAKWDSEEKSWYITDKKNLVLFDMIDLEVPFYCKDIAKDNGAMWDKENKSWKTSRFNEEKINELVKRELSGRVIE